MRENFSNKFNSVFNRVLKKKLSSYTLEDKEKDIPGNSFQLDLLL